MGDHVFEKHDAELTDIDIRLGQLSTQRSEGQGDPMILEAEEECLIDRKQELRTALSRAAVRNSVRNIVPVDGIDRFL